MGTLYQVAPSFAVRSVVDAAPRRLPHDNGQGHSSLFVVRSGSSGRVPLRRGWIHDREKYLAAMTFAHQMRDHQGRCQPHLLRLRMLARGDADTARPGQVTAEVQDATNAIISEAEAAGRALLGTTADERRQSEASLTGLSLAVWAIAVDTGPALMSTVRFGTMMSE